MKTQFDYQKRIVGLANLEAMCDHISGTCRTFKVVKTTPNRVYVEYSNPTEYGSPDPVQAVFPCWKHADNYGSVSVVLDAVRYIGCTGNNEEAWQSFDALFDCQSLHRAGSDNNDWETEYAILSRRNPGFAVDSTRDKDGCIQTWHCAGKDFKSWREAQDWAVIAMREYQNRVAA